MFTSIQIKNFKSIEDLTIELGRINVFIGENGAGKSNILEALALVGAAYSNKLDNEFLTSRGIRVTTPVLMRQAFADDYNSKPICITATDSEEFSVSFKINNDNAPYSKWTCHTEYHAKETSKFSSKVSNIPVNFKELDNDAKKIFNEDANNFLTALETIIGRVTKSKYKKPVRRRSLTKSVDIKLRSEAFGRLLQQALQSLYPDWWESYLGNFIIYSPEIQAIRKLDDEGQIEPVGINGQGLIRLLGVINSDAPSTMAEIKAGLNLLNWFDDFDLEPAQNEQGGFIRIIDRFIHSKTGYPDQRSVNDGFLLLTLYFTLFASEITPKFFAIDNIDASLNPKLCERLLRELCVIAVKNDKQVVLTTHNPAVLDGLNLDNNMQRLFIVSRDRNGRTKIRRYEKPKSVSDNNIRLSEAFLHGALGGLPKGF